MRARILGFLSLFTSLGTLICCALPALLVSLGLGAVVAAGVSAFPWLVSLSRNKEWVFLVAGILLAANGYFLYGPPSRRRICETGEGDARTQAACLEAGVWSRRLLWIAVGIYGFGVFMAYLALPLVLLLERA